VGFPGSGGVSSFSFSPHDNFTDLGGPFLPPRNYTSMRPSTSTMPGNKMWQYYTFVRAIVLTRCMFWRGHCGGRSMGGVRFFASWTVSSAKTSRSIVLSRSRSTFCEFPPLPLVFSCFLTNRLLYIHIIFPVLPSDISSELCILSSQWSIQVLTIWTTSSSPTMSHLVFNWFSHSRQ